MPDNLDSFLDGPSTPEPEPAPEPVVVAVEPEPEPAPAVPEPEPEPPAEGRQVPVAALQAERQQRQDWKEKAIRAEAERDALRASLEAAKTAPPAPPAPAPEPPVARPVPNPVEDPEGYLRYQDDMRFNDRLEITEDALRDKEGDEAVDKAIAAFKEMATKDPALGRQLRIERNPYRWLFKTVKTAEAAKDIGPDPAAWKEQTRAALRAELEAEMAAGTVAPPRQAVQLPQSLGTARSSAPRSVDPVTGPIPLSDILRK